MSEKKQEILEDYAYTALIEEAREKHLLDGVDCPFIPGRFEDGSPAVYDLTKEGNMTILRFPKYVSFYKEDYEEAREIIKPYPFHILGAGVSENPSEDFGSTQFDISQEKRAVLISSSSGLHLIHIIRISAEESSRYLSESSY